MLRTLLRKIVQVRLTHSAVVGLIATVSDLASLTLLVQAAGLTPDQANLPSLALGSMIQFFGHRNFVFHAWDGRLSKQLVFFGIAEFVAISMNALVFHMLVNWTAMPYQIARMLGGAVVFFGFSFPLWRLIFRTRQSMALTGATLNPAETAEPPPGLSHREVETDEQLEQKKGDQKGEDDEETPSPAALLM